MNDAPLKIMAVMGTRPDTIKMAPVVAALRAAGPAVAPVVCVTAQHREMLDEVLRLFSIVPDIDLNLMTKSQSLTEVTTRVLIGMEGVFRDHRPDVVLVHGDTTTSSATALAAFYAGVPVGHVEAGLRTASIREPFPEELNRRITGAIANVHFAPTSRSRENLMAERTDDSEIVVTGNTVIDAFLAATALVASRPAPAALAGLDPQRPLLFVTAHRRENHVAMPGIAAAIRTIAGFPDRPQILWPVHPSPQVAPVIHAALDGIEGVRLVAPLDYAATVAAVGAARFVLTDSGGLQEEAPTLGKPVLVMRRETERPEGLAAGTLQLVGAEPAAIVEWSRRLLDDRDGVFTAMARSSNPYGDGHAAERIVAWLLWKYRAGRKPAEFLAAAA